MFRSMTDRILVFFEQIPPALSPPARVIGKHRHAQAPARFAHAPQNGRARSPLNCDMPEELGNTPFFHAVNNRFHILPGQVAFNPDSVTHSEIRHEREKRSNRNDRALGVGNAHADFKGDAQAHGPWRLRENRLLAAATSG